MIVLIFRILINIILKCEKFVNLMKWTMMPYLSCGQPVWASMLIGATQVTATEHPTREVSTAACLLVSLQYVYPNKNYFGMNVLPYSVRYNS